MADPAFYNDPAKIADTQKAYTKITKDLEAAEEDWLRRQAS
jgi:hypothetical protein